MSNNTYQIKCQKETIELFRDIAEAEGNSDNEQLIKMMMVYNTIKLTSKTERLQKEIIEQTSATRPCLF